MAVIYPAQRLRYAKLAVFRLRSAGAPGGEQQRELLGAGDHRRMAASELERLDPESLANRLADEGTVDQPIVLQQDVAVGTSGCAVRGQATAKGEVACPRRRAKRSSITAGSASASYPTRR